jgi:hypothetical protein
MPGILLYCFGLSIQPIASSQRYGNNNEMMEPRGGRHDEHW